MRLFLVLLFALSLWAEETLLHFSHTFETPVQPDRLNAGMSLTFTRSAANEAKALAERAAATLRDLEGLCKGGAVNVTPEYRYDSGKTTLIGHGAGFDLTCEFAPSELARFDRVRAALQEAAVQNNGRFVLRAPQRTVSSVLQKQAQTLLENEALTYAFARLSNLRQNFNLGTCQIREISFQPGFIQPPVYRALSAKMESAEPLQSEEKLTLSANWTVGCK